MQKIGVFGEAASPEVLRGFREWRAPLSGLGVCGRPTFAHCRLRIGEVVAIFAGPVATRPLRECGGWSAVKKGSVRVVSWDADTEKSLGVIAEGVR